MRIALAGTAPSRRDFRLGNFSLISVTLLKTAFMSEVSISATGSLLPSDPSPKEVESRNGRRRGARAKTLNECALSLRGEPVHREAKYTSTGISVVMG